MPQAFVPNLPLRTPTAPIPIPSTRSSRSRPLPISSSPHAAAFPSLRSDDTALSAPLSPAEWLRVSEASINPPPNALRVGYLSSLETHTTESVSAPSRSSTTSSIPSHAPPPSRPLSAGLHISTSASALPASPPSYCHVAPDLTHLIAQLHNRIHYLGPVTRNKVVRAVDLAREAAASPATLSYNIAVALIVSDLQMDCDTVCAAILRGLIDYPGCSAEQVEHDVGADIPTILKFHARLEESVNLSVDSQFTEMSFSNLRELILVGAMDEHRAISLELARAVLAMRSVGALPDLESQLSVARRAMFLYAPLANQLGIWFVQSELEELAFMYLEPESYDRVRELVGERRRKCEDMLAHSKEFLERVLSTTPEVRSLVRTVQIKGRVKGLYSVYRKMRRGGKKVDEIYDLLALRVVVQPKKANDESEKNACYVIADVLSRFYSTLSSRGKDYIKEPKSNGYRSIHMTVLPHGGSTPLEIQIRSERMHHVAEFGAAAHWIYKEKPDEEECHEVLSDFESDDEDDGQSIDNDFEDMSIREPPGEDKAVLSEVEQYSEQHISPFSMEEDLEPTVRSDIRTASLRRPRSTSRLSSKASLGATMMKVATGGTPTDIRASSKSTSSNLYPRPRVPVRKTTIRPGSRGHSPWTGRQKTAHEERMSALVSQRLSMRTRVGRDELQDKLREGYVACLASAICASRVIVAAAGQLYGLAVGSTLLDLAHGLGVASLGAVAVVNGSVAPLTQRLEMNDIVWFIQA